MGLFTGGTGRELDLLKERVHRLELLLEHVARQNGIDAHQLDDVWAGEAEVAREARAVKGRGETIAAIKLVRQRTGLGLKDAKDVVDRL